MATPDLPVVMSMSVRPLQVTHLCFEVDGVIGQLNANLGDSVTPFDFNSFYTTLSGTPTVSGDLSRLQFDPATIQSTVGSSALAFLRAEPIKAGLLNSIFSRQNAYFAKYANASSIITAMNNFFSPSVTTSKPNRLATLSSLADQQASATPIRLYHRRQSGRRQEHDQLAQFADVQQRHNDRDQPDQSREYEPPPFHQFRPCTPFLQVGLPPASRLQARN